MITLMELFEFCSLKGQLPVPSEVFSGETDYRSDPVCKRLAYCSTIILAQLYWTLRSGEDVPNTFDDVFAPIELPFKNAQSPKFEIMAKEIFCQGVLAEYFLQTQDYARFKVWNDRFETSLANLRLADGGKLPVGRWI